MAAFDRRPRKANFSQAEIEVLMEQIRKKSNIIFGKPPMIITSMQKLLAWQEIANAVNNVSCEIRTVQELKNKWKHIKLASKGKYYTRKDGMIEEETASKCSDNFEWQFYDKMHSMLDQRYEDFTSDDSIAKQAQVYHPQLENGTNFEEEMNIPCRIKRSLSDLEESVPEEICDKCGNLLTGNTFNSQNNAFQTRNGTFLEDDELQSKRSTHSVTTTVSQVTEDWDRFGLFLASECKQMSKERAKEFKTKCLELILQYQN